MIFNSINKKGKEKDGRKGFTLIEVIVTVLILAVLGSMVIIFFWSSFTESSAPILRLKKSTDLQRVMANITADYKRYPIWKQSQIYQGDDVVIPTTYSVIGQRFYYKCTTPAPGTGSATSGSSEPAWIGSGTFNDGTLVWTYQGTLPTISELKAEIGAADSTNKKYDYGHDGKACASSSDCASGSICQSNMCKFGYYVIENKYIMFDAGNNEQEVTSGYILKVSIKNDSGEILSTMFF